MKPLIDANISVLTQLRDLVLLLDTASYNTVIPHTQSSIGKHIRHILDHFRAAKAGIEQGEIDYNRRTRHSPEETDSGDALEHINEFIVWFAHSPLKSKAINVISEIELYQYCSKTFSSNLDRELLYLINHSIHHLAYAALLAKLQNIEVPDHIGLAPSTASYERKLKETSSEKNYA